MTTYTIKQLGNGQLSDSTGDIYTAPALTQTIIKNIVLVNTDTSARTVNLYVSKSGGSVTRITPKDVSVGVGYQLIFNDDITLGPGDKVQGDASVASVVDYTVSGIEES